MSEPSKFGAVFPSNPDESGHPFSSSTNLPVAGAQSQPPAVEAPAAPTQPAVLFDLTGAQNPAATRLTTAAALTSFPAVSSLVASNPMATAPAVAPSVVQWAKDRNLAHPFLDVNDATCPAHLEAMDRILVNNELFTINHVKGLLAKETLTVKLFGLFEKETQATQTR